MQIYTYQELVGKRLLHNIFDNRNVMLIPENTVLTEAHISKLESFKVDLFDIKVTDVTEAVKLEDHSEASLEVVSFDPRELPQRMERAYKEIEESFRRNNVVPAQELESNVLPIITETVKKCNVYQILSQLKVSGDFRYKQCMGVSVVATMLGQWMKLEKQELARLTVAASLYDIGFVKLPDSVVRKESLFQPHEKAIMKQHTIFGYQILKDSGFEERIAAVALQHHEREDGSGYPHGLKGSEIDPLSKIVGIVDVYLSLISERPYRQPFTLNQAAHELHQQIVLNKFDSCIGLTLLNQLMASQIGKDVILSDDRKGKILLIDANYPTKPLISMENEYLDLTKTNTVTIKEIVG